MDEKQKYLKKYGSVIPCRARLSHESMFAPSDEQRHAASELLKLLPAPDPSKPIPWEESIWNPQNHPYALDQSPAGRLTLEMIRNSSVDGRKGDEARTPDSAAPESPAQVTNSSPPALEEDGTNPYLRKLDWPPRPSPPPPKPPEDDDTPHKWQAARPSTPDKSLRPISDEDFSNNSPIY
jgi:hypothetical protein